MSEKTMWNENKNYDYLDKSGQYAHAAGVIPVGASVEFNDGDIGRVIASNSDQSLIEFYNIDAAMTERDWFPNRVLAL